MSEADVAILQSCWGAYRQGDVGLFLSLLGPDIKVYPRLEEPGVRECYEGHQEMFEYIENWFSGWDEYTTDPVNFIDAGEYVVVDFKEVGVNNSSGMRIEANFAHAFKVEDGRVVEWRMFGPVSEAFEALGLEQV